MEPVSRGEMRRLRLLWIALGLAILGILGALALDALLLAGVVVL